MPNFQNSITNLFNRLFSPENDNEDKQKAFQMHQQDLQLHQQDIYWSKQVLLNFYQENQTNTVSPQKFRKKRQ